MSRYGNDYELENPNIVSAGNSVMIMHKVLRVDIIFTQSEAQLPRSAQLDSTQLSKTIAGI